MSITMHVNARHQEGRHRSVLPLHRLKLIGRWPRARPWCWASQVGLGIWWPAMDGHGWPWMGEPHGWEPINREGLERGKWSEYHGRIKGLRRIRNILLVSLERLGRISSGRGNRRRLARLGEQ